MIWPAEDIWQSCVPLLPALTVEVLKEVDSTNSELMRRARAGLTDPVLLVAESQTAGRGRLGRPWHAQAGDALTFSLGLMLHPADWSGLSLAVGLSVVESLDPQGALGLGLKWPNDVWVRQQTNQWAKLAGILIEMASTSAEEPANVVIGIGLNTNAWPDEVDPMNSDQTASHTHALERAHLHGKIERTALLIAIVRQLHGVLMRFEQVGFAAFSDAWNAVAAYRGLNVSLHFPYREAATGHFLGVNDKGALCLSQHDTPCEFHTGELSLRLAEQ